MKRTTVAAGVALLCFGGVRTARAAADKETCVSAYDQGQRAKLHGELLKAREQLAICARQSCPAPLTTECVQWLDDVNRVMPSIVIAVRGKDGGDLTRVRVTADGRALTDHLDGRPIEMDPGEHLLQFEAPGEDVPEQRVLVIEGQKARPVVAAARVPPPVPPVVVRPMPVAGWIAGGLAVAALGTFGVFAITGASDYGALPSCKCGSSSSWDRTEFVVADVALGIGIAALAVTAIIFFTRPSKTLNPLVMGARF